LGRTVTYLALGIVIVAGLLAVPAVSYVLQHYMHKLIGPLLIIVGMFLLQLLSFHFRGRGVSKGLQRRAEAAGIWGALLLGIVFALTFCPVSAALFFGSLIPLSVERGSRVLLPVVYGVGTALPVVVFALIIAFSAEWLGRAFSALTAVERWARMVTGVIFILIGIYFSLHYVYGVI
jgi:cytochrome c biogenesis protein CcdA